MRIWQYTVKWICPKVSSEILWNLQAQLTLLMATPSLHTQVVYDDTIWASGYSWDWNYHLHFLVTAIINIYLGKQLSWLSYTSCISYHHFDPRLENPLVETPSPTSETELGTLLMWLVRHLSYDARYTCILTVCCKGRIVSLPIKLPKYEDRNYSICVSRPWHYLLQS